MEIHPAAKIFPQLEGADFDALVEDIREHGQQQPIVIHDGMILDGRNRWRACQKLGIQPKTIEWGGRGSPETFVVSQNIMRRHLTPGQRAWLVSELCNIPPKIPNVLKNKENNATCENTTVGERITIQEAADMAGVHRALVADTRTVRERGTEEQKKAVITGRRNARTVASEVRIANPLVKKRKKRDAFSAHKNRENAQIWGHVRDALINLTSLPNIVDTVRIMRFMDRQGLVDERIDLAFQHLEEIRHEWKNS